MWEKDELSDEEFFDGVLDPESKARLAREFGLPRSGDEASRRMVSEMCRDSNSYDGALLAAICGAPEGAADPAQQSSAPVKTRIKFAIKPVHINFEISNSSFPGKKARRGRKTRRSDNPFLPKKHRTSDLTGTEFMKGYRAMDFAVKEGILMTCHVIIVWEGFGITDHCKACDINGMLLERARKWAKVGTPSASRQRRRERSGSGFDLAWIYVHEHASNRGFHTHILCNLPASMAASFEAWMIKSLQRLTKHHGSPRSVRVVPSRAKSLEGEIQRHWHWFTYVMKNLSPDVEWDYGGRRRPASLRALMKVYPYRGPATAITCEQLVRVSHNIGKTAQKAVGFRSSLEAGVEEADRIYSVEHWQVAIWRRERELSISLLNI